MNRVRRVKRKKHTGKARRRKLLTERRRAAALSAILKPSVAK